MFAFYKGSLWVSLLPFTGFRFLLVYKMFRLYQGESIYRRVKWAAFASEAPLLLALIVSFIPLLLDPTVFYLNFIAPTLVLPLTGWIITKVDPLQSHLIRGRVFPSRNHGGARRM